MRFYLPQLDGLRFFAFFLVFLHHLPSPAGFFEKGSFVAGFFQFLKGFGWMGVDLFLVLSAYLITKLLLLEYQTEHHISLRSFYVRRILRIWPLYYIMVGIGFFLLPAISLFAPDFSSPGYRELVNLHLAPYLLFVGNFSVASYGYTSVWTLSHLWTVGIEEQFYIIWPLLLCFLLRRKIRSIHRYLPLALLIPLVARAVLIGSSAHPMLWTNTLTRLDPLILGIFLAFYRNSVAPREQLAPYKFLAGLVCVTAIGFGPHIELQSLHVMWQYPLVAFGFMLIIDACISRNRGALYSFFANRQLVWLGKLTYGLYVYHILGIQFSKYLLSTVPMHLFDFSPLGRWLVDFSFALVLTILFATISYYGVERWFLKLKRRFAHVESRPV